MLLILNLLLYFTLNINILIANDEFEIDLRQFEKTIYSQNGEDGVIEAIFNFIGTESHYFVEFGGFDGYKMSNARALRDLQGWQGLMMDSVFEDLTINLQKEFITAENINTLFQKYDVPDNLDFLSIDLDFNDFYVWQSLDQKYKPRLVVVEYNATHPPDEDKVIKYDSSGCWDRSNYFGASILAFYNLAQKKGYSLVYAEQRGVNLFFIRNDLISICPYTFKNINDVKKIYVNPKYGYGPNAGHIQDPLNREYVRSLDLLNDS